VRVNAEQYQLVSGPKPSTVIPHEFDPNHELRNGQTVIQSAALQFALAPELSLAGRGASVIAYLTPRVAPCEQEPPRALQPRKTQATRAS